MEKQFFGLISAKLLGFVLRFVLTVTAYKTEYGGIGVHVYPCVTNCNATEPFGVIYIHGGGWEHGTAKIRTNQETMKALSDIATVYSIEYRLSDEASFPAGFTDCLTAVEHIIGRAQEHNISRHRFLFLGISAGGNLAAALVLYLTKYTKTQVMAQILIDPPLQATDFNTPSYLNKYQGHSRRQMLIKLWSQYAGGLRYKDQIAEAMMYNRHVPPSMLAHYASRFNHTLVPNTYTRTIPIPVYDPSATSGAISDTSTHMDEMAEYDSNVWHLFGRTFIDPRFAPLMAKSFTGLPPSLLYADKHDVLRDDVLYYAHQLHQAGVDVALLYDKEGYHAAFRVRGNRVHLVDAIHDLIGYHPR